MNTLSSIVWDTAGVTAVLASVFAFFKWLLPFIRDYHATQARGRSEEKTEEALRRHQKLYSTMQGLVSAGVERVIIFAGHNGGGIPHPGTPFFVSALHWVIDSRNNRAPEKYQSLAVDAEYVNLVADVAQDGHAYFEVEDMDPSQLRDIYEAEGVTSSLVLFLGIINKRVYFMTCASYTGELTDKQRTEAKLAANRISHLLQPL